MSPKVAIIGAGISGLSTAYFLNKKNINDINIFESNSKAGGVIQTFKNDKYIYELGPNTLSVSDSRIIDMFNDLDLKMIYPSIKSKNRFILKNGFIEKVPNSITSFLFSNLFSIKTKFKIFFEVFNNKKSNQQDESVHDFFERRFSSEFADYAINPFIAGTYSGNPENISLKHAFPSLFKIEKKYGSLTKGFLMKNKSDFKIKRKIISFKNGLFDLINALSIKFEDKIKYKAKINSIFEKNNKIFIEYNFDGKIQLEEFDKVILTVPTHKLNNINFREKLSKDVNIINKIYYPPLTTVTLAYKNTSFNQKINGFGILIPKKENMNILGVLHLSSMFSNRSPKDQSLITVYIGGARQPELTKMDEKMLLENVYKDLYKIYNIVDKPVFVSTKYWSKSIPQYEINYQKYLDAISSLETDCPGLIFNGNFKNGISLENNILNSLKTVKNLYE